jgi:uncharacterized membrane protein
MVSAPFDEDIPGVISFGGWLIMVIIYIVSLFVLSMLMTRLNNLDKGR